MVNRGPRMRDTALLSGWLFADLLLALAVIFMAANTIGIKPKPIPTVTPTPKPHVTPTPTPEPRLDFNFHRFSMNNVDYNGILNNNSAAVMAVEQFINGKSVLHNRNAGLVIVYDGAPSDADITDAQNIVHALINNVFKVMGRQGPLFQRTSYYDPLFILGPSHGYVVFDIYLFQQ